jgi:hypothetical protein
VCGLGVSNLVMFSRGLPVALRRHLSVPASEGFCGGF